MLMKSLRAAKLITAALAVLVIFDFVYVCMSVIQLNDSTPLFISLSVCMISIGSILDSISKSLCKCPKCSSKIPIDVFKGKKKELLCLYCKEVLIDEQKRVNVRFRFRLRASRLFDFLSTIVVSACLLSISIYAIVIRGSLFVAACDLVLLLGFLALRFRLVRYQCPTCHSPLSLDVLPFKDKHIYCPHCAIQLKARSMP